LFTGHPRRDDIMQHSKRSHKECDGVPAGDTDVKMSDHDDPTESAAKRSNNNDDNQNNDFTEFDDDI
jgi:hypothetical protein